MKTPRRRAREFAVQGMYQALLNPDYSSDEIIANIRESDAFVKALAGNKKPHVDEELFESLIRGVNANKLKYAPILRPLLDRNENDVSPIEYAILFVACHELIAMPQTPYPVIINEAIEIGKAFGGTEGYKFINGILDKLASQVRPNDPEYHSSDKNNIKVTSNTAGN